MIITEERPLLILLLLLLPLSYLPLVPEKCADIMPFYFLGNGQEKGPAVFLGVFAGAAPKKHKAYLSISFLARGRKPKQARHCSCY